MADDDKPTYEAMEASLAMTKEGTERLVSALTFHHLEKDEIVQIVPSHKWGGCLAVVDEPKSFGCQAYVTIPTADESSARAYIRLNWDEFEKVGTKAIFVLED